MFMFGIEYGNLHDVTCDWCEQEACASIYSHLAVQRACDEHLADWLLGQVNAFAGDEPIKAYAELAEA